MIATITDLGDISIRYEILIYKTTLQPETTGSSSPPPPTPPDRRHLHTLHHWIDVTSTPCRTVVKRDADDRQLAARNQYARPILYDIRPPPPPATTAVVVPIRFCVARDHVITEQ